MTHGNVTRANFFVIFAAKTVEKQRILKLQSDLAAIRLEALMGCKPRPSRLATLTKIPATRPGRPYKTLSSAVARSASERELLVMLRKRLAAKLDGDDLQLAVFTADQGGAGLKVVGVIDASVREKAYELGGMLGALLME